MDTERAALRRGYLSAGIVVAIWTGFVIVSRLGSRTSLTSYDIIALRYAVAALLFLPLWWRHRTPVLDGRRLILSLSGAVVYSLFVFAGFRHAPASHAAILLPGFLPFAITCLAWLILNEIPSPRRRLGLVIIALGVGCVAVENFGRSGIAITGDALMLGGSVCWALYTVLLRRWGLAPMDTAISVTLLAAAMYLPCYALWLPSGLATASWQDIALQAFYQGVIAAFVQMMLYARSVALLGPTRMGLVMALVPVSAGVAAVPLLGEPLSLLACLGLLLVSLGAWVGNRLPRNPHADTQLA